MAFGSLGFCDEKALGDFHNDVFYFDTSVDPHVWACLQYVLEADLSHVLMRYSSDGLNNTGYQY